MIGRIVTRHNAPLPTTTIGRSARIMEHMAARRSRSEQIQFSCYHGHDHVMRGSEQNSKPSKGGNKKESQALQALHNTKYAPHSQPAEQATCILKSKQICVTSPTF